MYLLAMSMDTVVIKHIISHVELGAWGLVYYNNLLALCFMPVGSFVTGEIFTLARHYKHGALAVLLSPAALLPVVISCVFGVAISYFGLNTRRALTATAFTVVGVVCKFGTV